MKSRRSVLQMLAATPGAISRYAAGTASLGMPILSDRVTAKEVRAFRQPDEAAEHERTFMQWPVSRKVHDDAAFLAMLQKAVAEVANAISAFEPVIMLMDARFEPAARRKLSKRVEIWPIATDDLWCRDSGPTFVVDQRGKLAIAHLRFNGWGNKQVHANDGKIVERLAARLGLDVIDSGLVGEAGGVENDGAGTLLAHESCWVNTNRNRDTREVIERKLLAALGAKKMIWAPGVKGADITDYHIDALARFSAPGTVVIQLPEKLDPDDPWSRSAFETRDILKKATDASGRKLELVVLPEPVKPRVKASDFVASYVNYYVCNKAVILAEFGDRDTDSEAALTLKRLYPGREIIALNVDAIGEVGGGIHCATQQQPIGSAG